MILPTIIVNGDRYDFDSILKFLNKLENDFITMFSVELNDNYEFNKAIDQFTVNVIGTVIAADDLTIVENQFSEFNMTLRDVNGECVPDRLIEVELNGKSI